MRKILRASQIVSSPGLVDHRVVLVHQVGEGHTPLVVWYQFFPEEGQPHFGTGDYFAATEVDQAHRRFEARRDRTGRGEDLAHEMSLLRHRVALDEKAVLREVAQDRTLGVPLPGSIADQMARDLAD